MELVRLLMADFTMAFMWVSLNATLRVLLDLVAQYIGLYDDARQFLKRSAVVGLLFVFYWLSKVTGGASYNPVTVIAYVAAKITDNPFYILIFRVPAQVLGAIAGVSTAVTCMPDAYRPMLTGPYLQVDPHIGALAEGVLTFAVVFIVLVANVRGPKSGIQKTWITSISRVSLSTFGARYTGPAMNPANAFGWAFLRDQHNFWEHLYVYWVTPILATLVAAWMVRRVVIPTRKPKEKRS